MTAPDPLAVARKVHEALELLNGRKLAIGGVAIVADALTEYRNEGIEEAKGVVAFYTLAHEAFRGRGREIVEQQILPALDALKRTP